MGAISVDHSHMEAVWTVILLISGIRAQYILANTRLHDKEEIKLAILHLMPKERQ